MIKREFVAIYFINKRFLSWLKFMISAGSDVYISLMTDGIIESEALSRERV